MWAEGLRSCRCIGGEEVVVNGLITPAIYCSKYGHWWGKDDRCETCKVERHPWVTLGGHRYPASSPDAKDGQDD